MNNLRLAMTAVFLLTTSFAAHAQTAKPEEKLTANPVYQENCAKCHGKTAEGRHFAGPSLVSDKAAASSVDDFRNIIANGKHHMPKFAGKLSAGEIDALVDQIKAAKKE